MTTFKNQKTTSVSGQRQADAASRPNHALTLNRQKRYALKSAAAREKLHDLWTPCLLEYLRQEERHGRPHTLVSLERRFATYVAKSKGFVQGLIKALVRQGTIQFFHPALKDNLPKSPSRNGYLRCDGMGWGKETATSISPAASVPSNENAALLAASSTQGA